METACKGWVLKNLQNFSAVYDSLPLSCCSVNWMQCLISDSKRLWVGKSARGRPVVNGLRAGGGLFAQTAASDDKYAMGAVATADANPNPPWRNGACKVSTNLRVLGGKLFSSVSVIAKTWTAVETIDSSNC